MPSPILGFRWFAAIPIALAVLLLPAPEAGAESREETAEVDLTDASFGRGLTLYQRYCRSCHGKSAEGDGTVAEYLRVVPTDLTRLALTNGGEFPVARVVRSIDGREKPQLHGDDMPIWGSVFQVDADQTEEDAKRKIHDLVAYLMGIQTEEPAADAGD